MSEKKRAVAAGRTRGQQPVARNPLDIVPEKIPFDVPCGPPISLERAQAAINVVVAEAKKRDWKMNVAVVDSGGNLVAFQRMDGAMLASIEIAEHKARAAATFRRETKFFENGIQVNHLNYLMTLDGIVASRGAIPLVKHGKLMGAMECSRGPILRIRPRRCTSNPTAVCRRAMIPAHIPMSRRRSKLTGLARRRSTFHGPRGTAAAVRNSAGSPSQC